MLSYNTRLCSLAITKTHMSEILYRQNQAQALVTQHLEDSDNLPNMGEISVSLARWQTESATWATRDKKQLQIGVRVPPTADVEADAEILRNSDFICLDFPVVNTKHRHHHFDGRAYSQARLLRERVGFTGEIRASGHVLRDQLLLMHRCGVTAYVLPAETNIADFAAGLAEFTLAYQGAVNDLGETVFARRRAAWAA